ncbi:MULTISPECIES: hypothetical protein [Vibrio]|uniref:Uncharacterized protein n=1 Tax=Vibrio tasmaniensis TaxID=212663 RepID=A0A2N7NCP8_9VIBR|nr:hypothetical protein [Vibrio tasmaniensis]PMO89854.1 hypothetical protein BCT01_00815 [Vibrio tasmaniensis]PMP09974.1 hypothetical protein BCS92_02275 [Vibrio tasmaniensis]TKG27961.1 hypothetical protein FC057_22500 [Vibrio tasmaniensis]TKG40554.1 hypothetical protein FC060_23885 [Vibrio tasmaniensis]TKG41674.1 hypothetical protein FC063_07370 [Vibrio tasmaniensis]
MKFYEVWPDLVNYNQQFNELVNNLSDDAEPLEVEFPERGVHYIFLVTVSEVGADEDTEDFYKNQVIIQKILGADDLSHGMLVDLEGEVNWVSVGSDIISIDHYFDSYTDTAAVVYG